MYDGPNWGLTFCIVVIIIYLLEVFRVPTCDFE